MKVALINPRGFCFGVRRALEMMDDIKNQNVYVLHEIVHNKNVMEGYVKKVFDLPKVFQIYQRAVMLLYRRMVLDKI